MDISKLEFEGVKGVGSMDIEIDSSKYVSCFIGENGVGKTKFLESFFQVMFVYSDKTQSLTANEKTFVFNKAEINSMLLLNFGAIRAGHAGFFANLKKGNDFSVSFPVVFLGSQSRGFVAHDKHASYSDLLLGDFSSRQKRYLNKILKTMCDGDFSSMNMDEPIELWFVKLAQSSNTYQRREDNRKIEIDTVLGLLHQLDEKIDPNFLEVTGKNRVLIKIDGQKRELSQLSTGYASILKIIQSIISGYSSFTNEVSLSNVRGYVFVDEIESHLHIRWQSKIIPLLKKMFPNTTFFITTHSPLVMTRLESGEAYKLVRENDGVVRSKELLFPGNAALVDLLKDAFDLDLNKEKIDATTPESQAAVRKKILELLG